MQPLAPLAAVAIAAALAGPARARPGVEVMLGTAWNAPVPLHIRQSGHEWLRFTARYSTRAFEFPLYYVARGTLTGGDGAGWALELVHHKLHLTNPPREVSAFSVSHGYNLLLLSRLRPRGPWRWGAGGGVVVAHPENTVRGLAWPERLGLFRDGYYLAGTAVTGFAGRRVALGTRAHAVAEARLAMAWARVPVAQGSALAPHLGLHLALGLGGTLGH
jgi:hypothetical protein